MKSMFLSESLMFEGRLSKTGWQRPEFEPNNPKFIKKRGTWSDLRLTICLYWMMNEIHECLRFVVVVGGLRHAIYL